MKLTVTGTFRSLSPMHQETSLHDQQINLLVLFLYPRALLIENFACT